jgi:hypothetical protein
MFRRLAAQLQVDPACRPTSPPAGSCWGRKAARTRHQDWLLLESIWRLRRERAIRIHVHCVAAGEPSHYLPVRQYPDEHSYAVAQPNASPHCSWIAAENLEGDLFTASYYLSFVQTPRTHLRLLPQAHIAARERQIWVVAVPTYDSRLEEQLHPFIMIHTMTFQSCACANLSSRGPSTSS